MQWEFYIKIQLINLSKYGCNLENTLPLEIVEIQIPVRRHADALTGKQIHVGTCRCTQKNNDSSACLRLKDLIFRFPKRLQVVLEL